MIRLLLFLSLLVGQPAHAADARSRVALILSGPDGDHSIEELAARRALQTLGIGYDRVLATRLNEAYPVAILPGPLYNHTLSKEAREAVYRYVAAGGVLIATQVEGSDWFPLFGIEQATPQRNRFRIRFQDSVEDGWLRYLDHPNEREISLGDPKVFNETIWSIGYIAREGRPLAIYPGDAAAALVNDYEAGQALALGISLSQTILLAHVGQAYEAGRQWVNSFEPSGDVFLLLLRGIYESTAHPAVYWHTVPRGLETAIVLSHDVDARESFGNAVVFAKLARQYGVRSTVFITTKIYEDDADIGYYDASRIPSVVEVKRLGMEIGSHSLSHSKRFAAFPIGTPTVSLRTYHPRRAPTVAGEVKVSKELLDRDVPDQRTESFRAGELAFPAQLIEALEWAGYRYDSTFSANNIVTNFPFFAFRQNRLGAPETSIVEVPVTVDDSQGYLTGATKTRVIQAWTDIIEANRANAAMTCILIHPTDITYKLEVFRQILAHYSRQPVWIGPVSALGEFWMRRSRAGFQVTVDSQRITIRLDASRSEFSDDLSLVVTHADGFGEIQVLDRDGQPILFDALRRRHLQVLVLKPARLGP